jgi:hypothetical protein
MTAIMFASALVLTAVGDRPASARHVEVRVGDAVTLYAAVRAGGLWYTDAPRVRGVSRRKVRPLSALADGVETTWSLVEPQMFHVTTAPPNVGNPAYSNSVLFGPGHGRWLGYDTLEYTERPLSHSGAALRITKATPTDPHLARNAGLGTMRYRISVVAPDGRSWQSPGADATSRTGIKNSVRRVSFRGGDDLVGWLESYFNVPNVFGSAGVGRRHQTDRHQGADCADVIVGAARKAGARLPYTSVAGLHRHTRSVSDVLRITDGRLFDADEAEVELRWGKDLRKGDLVLIKYGVDFTGRAWDHIAVLVSDRGLPGVLDPEDEVLHMGYLYGLVREPLGAQRPAIIKLSRFRRRI